MDFTNTRISLARPIWDYTKVKQFHSSIVRCQSVFISQEKIKKKKYLNVGCGSKIFKEFINLDYSWSPSIDICWDVTEGIPLASNSVRGLFSEHCFEHLPFSKADFVLKEFLRVLEPQGILRIIVPDAQLYLKLYQEAQTGENISFPYQRSNEVTPMMSVNRIFREHGHLFSYDFDTLLFLLKQAGFSNIERSQFNQGRNSDLLIDSEGRAIESLYVEAQKL